MTHSRTHTATYVSRAQSELTLDGYTVSARKVIAMTDIKYESIGLAEALQAFADGPGPELANIRYAVAGLTGGGGG